MTRRKGRKPQRPNYAEGFAILLILAGVTTVGAVGFALLLVWLFG